MGGKGSGRHTIAQETRARDAITEVVAPKGTPEKPGWLPDGAAKYWDEIVKMMSLCKPCQLSVVDAIGVASLAAALWDHENVLKIIADDESRLDLHARRALKAATEDIKHWSTKLYLEPTARSKAKVKTPIKSSETGFAKLLAMHEAGVPNKAASLSAMHNATAKL